MTQKIAIDIGYGDIKVAYMKDGELSTFKFPSAVARVKESQAAFRNSIAVGDKRFRAILKKYDGSAWKTTRGINNSLIFEPIKLPNLPNDGGMDFITAKQ